MSRHIINTDTRELKVEKNIKMKIRNMKIKIINYLRYTATCIETNVTDHKLPLC